MSVDATEEDLLAAMATEAPAVEERDASDAEKKEKRSKKSKKEKKEKKEKREKKSKKDKAPKRSRFIDDAAGEGSDDESEVDDDGEAAEVAEQEDYIKNYQPKREFFDYEGDEHEIAAQIEAKVQYKKQMSRAGRAVNVTGGGGGGGGGGAAAASGSIGEDQRFAASRLPRESDPKVFAIKCRPGMARTLVARIVNKCYHYRIGNNDEHKRADLGIISVFSVDHIKEYFYVEAYRQLFVENALQGLEGLFRFKMSLVDPQELMQLMERPTTTTDKLKVGGFVRLRQAPYKGDLGQVVELVDDEKRAVVRVVPREDFVKKPYAKPPRKVAVPMEQKFFIPNLAVGTHKLSNGQWRWGELIFDEDGYLCKTTSTRQLFFGSKMVPPSLAELKTFFKGDKNKITQYAPHAVPTEKPEATELRLGDVVRVHRGPLTNLVGRISLIDLNKGTLKISQDGTGKEALASLNEVTRYFATGSPVLIMRGEHKNISGVVLRQTEKNTVILVTREGRSELEVPASDCKQSSLDVTGAHTFSTWRLYDLVMLADGLSVGCIVQLNDGRISIVTSDNGTRLISPSDIKQKVQHRVSTVDRFTNIVSRGDEVRVEDPMAPRVVQGLTARVEQIFNETIFAVSNGYFRNSGLFAVSARYVTVIGGRSKVRAPDVRVQQLPALERKAHPAKRAENVTPMMNLPPAAEDWADASGVWN